MSCYECGVELGRFPHTTPKGDVCEDCCARCKPPTMPWPTCLDAAPPREWWELPVVEVLGRLRTAMYQACEYLEGTHRDELDTIADRLYDLLGNLEADYPSPQTMQGDLLEEGSPF